MSRRGIRLTFRFWMSAALVVALLMALPTMIGRSMRFRALADWHAGEEAIYSAALRLRDERVPSARTSASDRILAATEGASSDQPVSAADVDRALLEVFAQAVTNPARKLAYHRMLRRKYQAAASRPWEFVAPDPPPPADRASSAHWRSAHSGSARTPTH